MSQAIRIVIRLAEPIRNRANGTEAHAHWSKRTGPARDLRDLVFTVASGAPLRDFYARWRVRNDRAFPELRADAWIRGDLDVLLTRIAPRELDEHDGLPNAFKPVVDALTDALGRASDRDPTLVWRYAQRRGEVREAGIEILIEPRRACAGCGQAAEREWRICPMCGQALAQVDQEQQQVSKRAGRVSARSVR